MSSKDLQEFASGEIKIENLNAKHLSIFNYTNNKPILSWLQALFFKSQLANIENNLHNILSYKNPSSVVATIKSELISILISQPLNLRGKCWSLQIININNNINSSKKYIIKRLFEKTLELKNEIYSLLTRFEVNELEGISSARELGFQPLRVYKSWTMDDDSSNSYKKQAITRHTSTIEWQNIDKKNAKLLWQLEKVNLSVHLRQILSREWQDLLTHRGFTNKVLIDKSGYIDKAIAGLIARDNYNGEITLELIRDFAWDERLVIYIPDLINYLYNKNKKFYIEVNSEDNPLNKLLEEQGLKFDKEIILLGRNIWRRQENKKPIKVTSSLEEIIGKLNPQNPPIPSP